MLGTRHRAFGTGHLAPGIWHRAFGTGHLAPGIWHRALGIGHLAPGTWHRALGTGHLAPGTWHRALGTWHWAPWHSTTIYSTNFSCNSGRKHLQSEALIEYRNNRDLHHKYLLQFHRNIFVHCLWLRSPVHSLLERLSAGFY